MSSILSVLNLGTCSRSAQVPFEQALEELEQSLEANKKAIRYYTPKNPVIGVPPGTVLLGDSAMEDGSMGLVEEEETEDEDEDEATRQMDDSSGALDDADLVGELDDSGSSSDSSLGGGGSPSEFV
jgi:hypothetical protein